MGAGGQRHAPAALPRERPGTHCIGSWVGPRGRSGRVWKISPTPGFDRRRPARSKSLYRSTHTTCSCSNSSFPGFALKTLPHFLWLYNVIHCTTHPRLNNGVSGTISCALHKLPTPEHETSLILGFHRAFLQSITFIIRLMHSIV